MSENAVTSSNTLIRHTDFTCGMLIVVAAVSVYFTALGGGFIWDDDAHVLKNVHLRTAEGLSRIWFDRTSEPQYYPIVHTSFWLEYQLWGLAPFGYHLNNVLLHALNAVLCWLVLRKIGVPGAWLAGMVFALHPVHVESVAWITERKNVLSGAFYLAAVLAYWRFDSPNEPTQTRNWRFYSVALILFCCALLSKSVTSTLPAALLLVVWYKRGRITVPDVLPLLPMFLLGILAGLNTAHLEKYGVGAVGPEWDFSFCERLLIAGRAAWFYAGKLVWPHPLIFFYPRWTIDSSQWWQYLFPVAAAGLVVCLWLVRKKLGRGPLVGVLYFGGTLFPALGFFNVYPMQYSFVADHFQYLASLGIIAVLVAASCQVAKRIHLNDVRFQVGAGVVLILLGALTWRQGREYECLETLYVQTIHKNPSAWMAHINLGILRARQGRIEDAISHFRTGLAYNPQDVRAHINWGFALEKLGCDEEAVFRYRAVLAISPEVYGGRPEVAEARLRLGAALNRLGRYSEAIDLLRPSVEQNSQDSEAHFHLGTALLSIGSIEEAVSHFSIACEADPEFVESYINCGVALAKIGRFDDAIRCLQQAALLSPDNVDARYNLGR
ncbi:MAG: tetratricopeptide repeat protein, partial [Rhodopirellula sp.]|nr:tetratricopeptide repeat protein [Rhodopirellula sp.]